MATKPDQDFDDLLDLDEDTGSDSEESSSPDLEISAVLPVTVTAPTETPEQQRIRELEEKLERATAALEAAARQVAPDLSDKEKQEAKDKAHALAAMETKRITESPVSYEEDDGENKILIHILEDGFTAFATTWKKGQEIEIAVDGRNYQRTVDREGKSWLDLRNDPSAQRRRWGRVMFAEGPYPWRNGEVFDLNAAKEDQERRRAVPISF